MPKRPNSRHGYKRIAFVASDTRAAQRAQRRLAARYGDASPDNADVIKAHNAAENKVADAQYDVDKAKAEADKEVADARCKTQAGAAHDSCMATAKAAYDSAVAAAKAKNDAAHASHP